MGEMHENEVVGSGDVQMDRLSVPGGWIYLPKCWGAADSNTRPVYVPAPPRLVRLDFVEEGNILVNPTHVIAVANDKTDGTSFVVLSAPAASVSVKGTPAEVAAKLGLEVTS